jgi:uncharacterized protein DUF1638
MSSSATEATSTTASSTSSASNPSSLAANPPSGRIVDSSVHPGVQNYPLSWGPSSSEGLGNAGRPIEIVACGALAAHIREIAARRGWPVIVRPLPAALHNRPQRITGDAERAIADARASGAKPVVLAYADCGTYGALDNLATEAGVSRLPGLHCYDLYAGEQEIEQLFAEEPGTYLLTDYLIRSFDKAVIKPLGLDRHPDLWKDYFAHYRRLVWLAQRPTPQLEEAATRIASQFNLPLTRRDTGTTGLEAALTRVIEPPR